MGNYANGSKKIRAHVNHKADFTKPATSTVAFDPQESTFWDKVEKAFYGFLVSQAAKFIWHIIQEGVTAAFH